MRSSAPPYWVRRGLRAEQERAERECTFERPDSATVRRPIGGTAPRRRPRDRDRRAIGDGPPAATRTGSRSPARRDRLHADALERDASDVPHYTGTADSRLVDDRGERGDREQLSERAGHRWTRDVCDRRRVR